MADQGIDFTKSLRSSGFSKGLEFEAKLQMLKCKALLSKKIDIPREKKIQEFRTASLRIHKLMSEAGNA